MTSVIVVGTGVAGLIAALRASENHDVTVVTKSELAESNTRYAQGGIAAVMFADDSVEDHVEDTMVAGAGLNSREVVEILCGEGPDRIRDLIRIGVAFDRVGSAESTGGSDRVGSAEGTGGGDRVGSAEGTENPARPRGAESTGSAGGVTDAPGDDRDLARGREAAHSAARVLHAGGDSTGAAIEQALVAAVRASAVRILENTFVSDLVLENGRVVGVEILDQNGRADRLWADTVILASGGAGQLYLHTTNPMVATGDGIAAAARAGAVLADLEFYQFHPTALDLPGSFLISEAVRGEGATLLDERGQRFMLDVHPDAELAPRDIVARGMAAQMARQNGAPILLDATALGADFLAERFPSIDRTCRANGLDWSTQPIPVSPAAHYWMGGIRTDLWGRSSLPGLIAVGETACTGAHGANRLASNSLLEALVFAWRSVEKLDEAWPTADAAATAVLTTHSPAAGEPFARVDLQRLMWQHAGVFRSGEGLRDAATQLDRFAVRFEGRSGAALVAAHEDANLLDLARLVVVAARARAESRGAHYRSDFPHSGDALIPHFEWVVSTQSVSTEIGGLSSTQGKVAA